MCETVADTTCEETVAGTAPQRLKGYERWKKCPSDGTSYSCWVLGAERPADGGFLIETKPRFGGMGYFLFLPHSIAVLPGYGIKYERLKAAKLAAEMPVRTLIELHRCEVLRSLGLLASWAGVSLEEKVSQVCKKMGVPVGRVMVRAT